MSKENRKGNGDGDSRPRPVQVCKLGRISAAVWANETQAGLMHNVTITRTYKEGETFKRSDSYGLADLPLVARVADMALAWIYKQSQQKNGDSHKETDDENIPF